MNPGNALVRAELKWTKPVYQGDTIRSEVTLVDKKSLEDHRGLVTLKARVDYSWLAFVFISLYTLTQTFGSLPVD
jgi:acyl dehydratase